MPSSAELRRTTAPIRAARDDKTSPRFAPASSVRHRRRHSDEPMLPISVEGMSWERRRKRGRKRGVLHRRMLELVRYLGPHVTARLTIGGGRVLLMTMIIAGWLRWRRVSSETSSSGFINIKRPTSPLSLQILVARFSDTKSLPTFRSPLEMTPSADEEGWYVDYGPLLDLRLLEEEGARRVIFHDWNEDQGGVHRLNWKERDDDNDQYHAYDDDVIRNPYMAYEDDGIAKENHCRRTNWHRLQYPTCNEFHAADFVTNVPRYLSHGAYREVFLFNVTEEIIWKEIRRTKEMEYDNFEFVRVDAMVSERLSSDPRVVDIYGFCGMSLFTEYFPGEDLEALVLPTGGYFRKKHRKVKEQQGLDVLPLNNLTASAKLNLALQIAEAIAALHNYEGGVIVHDDVQPAQFLFAKDGQLKINDFNRAEPMLWDEEHHEYCKYRNGPGQGSYRAPEEYVDKPLNEKIDVWSYGNLLYSILTGLWNFYDVSGEGSIDSADVVQQKVINGETPHVDPAYTSRSFGEGKIVELIKLCWKYEPDDRPSIDKIVRFLRSAIQDSKKVKVGATS